jgi:hypothetical protein
MASVLINSDGLPVDPYLRTQIVRAWRRLTNAVTRDVEASRTVEATQEGTLPGYTARVSRLFTLADVAEQ